MELYSGNIFVRIPTAPLAAGQIVGGHGHHFPHTTVCLFGELDVTLLDVKDFDAAGQPCDFVELETHTLKAGTDNFMMLILAGRWHLLKAKVDGTRYGCFYSHQYPQAINMMEPGKVPQPPVSKRDEDGSLWYRVNEDIAQDSQGWAIAYQ